MYFTRRAALSTLAAALVLTLPERALANRLSTLLPADAADTSDAVHPIVPTAATQAVVVNAASWGTSSATVTAYRWTSGAWVAEIGPVPAGIGSGGFTATPHEADGNTPVGMYSFTTVFGSRQDPGALFPYVQATASDHWVDDPTSAVYNTWQTGPSNGRWRSAETLSAYPYAAAFDFNQNPVVPNGNSAIFLHGGGGATPGCIEIAQTPLLAILRWLDPAASAVIVLGVNAAPPPHVDPAPVPEDPTVAVATARALREGRVQASPTRFRRLAAPWAPHAT